jgi:hypothetical protein
MTFHSGFLLVLLVLLTLLVGRRTLMPPRPTSKSAVLVDTSLDELAWFLGMKVHPSAVTLSGDPGFRNRRNPQRLTWWHNGILVGAG